jgi:pyruvate/2-oxoglutarate dehydrogenase complex dihydrolipoamide acyltransferase (E2) component
VTLLCDHRVVDGIVAARALTDLETALHGPIVAELKTMQSGRAAA